MQVTRAEFVLLWASFLIIMATDLQRGILLGIVLAVFYFAWSYAQASACPAHAVAFQISADVTMTARVVEYRHPADCFTPDSLRLDNVGCHMRPS